MPRCLPVGWGWVVALEFSSCVQEGKYTVTIELLESGAYKMEQAGPAAAAAAASFLRISP